MSQYVALLRGINVGGHQVPMAKLRKALEGAGCEGVTTILASGNVVFEGGNASLPSLTRELETTLAETFGFPIPVLLRTRRAFEEFVKSEPFRGVKVTPETRLYVTFFSEKPKSTAIPKVRSKGFQFLRVTDSEACSVLRLSATAGTVDVMNLLEDEFGKRITTRNWNTVAKIAKVLDASYTA